MNKQTPWIMCLLCICLLLSIGDCTGDDDSDGRSDDDDDNDTGDDDTGDDDDNDTGDDDDNDTGDDDTGDDDDDDTGDDDTGDDDDDDTGDIAWMEITPSGNVPDPVGFIETVTDAAAGRMIYYGGFGETFADEVVTFAYGTNTFGRITATGDTPPGLYGPAIGWDSAESRFYLYGGNINTKGSNTILYVLDTDTSVWTEAGDGTASLGGRQLSNGTWDDDRFLVYGGYAPDSDATFQDTWAITWNGNPGEAVFTQVATIGPDPRSNAAACFQQATGKWYLYGGAGSGATVFGDLWVMDTSSDTWSEVTTTGTPPPAVHSARCHVDEGGQYLILFGGIDFNVVEYNDIWILNMAASPPRWNTLSPVQDITPRYAGAMAYDATGGRLIYFGGALYDNSEFTFYNNIYELVF